MHADDKKMAVNLGKTVVILTILTASLIVLANFMA